MNAVRQISRTGSVRLLADLLADAEVEVSKLRTIMLTHFCTCQCGLADPLDVQHHAKHCRYRELLS